MVRKGRLRDADAAPFPPFRNRASARRKNYLRTNLNFLGINLNYP